MLPNDRAQPAAPDKPSWAPGCCTRYRRLPIWLKVVIGHRRCSSWSGLIILAALVYGIVAVAQGRRTVGASVAVALWGLVVFSSPTRATDLALLGDPAALRWSRWPPTPSRWPAGSSRAARSPGSLAWSVPAGVIALKAASGQPFLGTIAAWLLAAAVLGWRVAKSIQDTRMYGGRTGTWEKPPAGPAGNAPPAVQGGPARPAIPAPPRPECPGAGRGAALRRARRPRPPGRPPRPRPADLGRGRDGRTRRDDRADPGQGAGPLDRRVHRGGAAAHGGRHQHRAADAALRVPRPARHREDDGGPGAGQDLLRVRPAPDARGRSRRTGPTWSGSTSARPRSRPTSSSTPRWAGCCSSTRRTAWSTRATGRPTGSARRRCRRCSSGPRTTATT